MAKIVLDMSMSLDGFIAGPDAQAKAAADERNILLHGATSAQECLRAGLLDEMEIHLIPVLLGHGRRLFDGLSPDHIELDPVRSLEAPGVMHLHYRVRAPQHREGQV